MGEAEIHAVLRAILDARENYCGHIADYTTFDGEPRCGQCLLEAHSINEAAINAFEAMRPTPTVAATDNEGGKR